MLNLFPTSTPDCESPTRRRFLMQVGALGGLGISLDAVLRQKAAFANSGLPSPGDVNCILIWTQGGTSHHESIDPKPEAQASVRGEFGVIDTALPGIQFCETMPHFARNLKNYSVMRNLNPQNGSHSIADAIMLSGKKFNQSITYPCYGSVVARELGFKNSLPPFIQVGDHVDHRARGGLAGFLGIEYNAFVVPGDPSSDKFKVRDVEPPGGMPLSRLDRRRQALELLDNLPRQAEAAGSPLEATDKYYQSAFSMITSAETRKAFELEEESAATRETYGNSYMGQSCLLARRLIESGSRFVTVSEGGYDTHSNNFKTLKKRLPPLDQGIMALINDLRDRGMLDNTLVMWMTDFGRTAVINANSGRDHSSAVSYVVAAGAGIAPGQVIGGTDAKGERIVGKEYYARDIAATLYTKMGIPLDTEHHSSDGRPIFLCEGEPVPEFMS